MRKRTVLGMVAVGGALAMNAVLRRGAGGGTARPATGLPTMSLSDTLAFLTDVGLPNLAKGVIKRRKRVVGAAEAADLDRRAVCRMQQLHEKYGPGPALLKIPVRNQAVIFEPEDGWRVLEQTPEPFSPASSEKKAALGHFQPHGALISEGAERAERRRFNDDVLESGCPIHSLTESFARAVQEETEELFRSIAAEGELDWDAFSNAWFRVVRRVVFGEGARGDVELRRMVDELRYDANWAFLKPRDKRLRKAFLERVRHHLRRAGAGSLAERIAEAPKNESTKPEHQVPQWLFAFDPAGMATYRALGLLAAHPDQLARARFEADVARATHDRGLPFIRASILEALRLWPTTPLILRQTTSETRWATGVLPAGAGVAIFAPFFHRDDRQLPFANRFAPDIWSEDPPMDGWPLVPFSAGPGVCPGQHVALLLGSLFIARLIEGHQVRLSEPERLNPDELPGTFDHYSMRYRLLSG